MLRKNIEMKTIAGQGWGKTAQVLLPGGPTYYGFHLDTRVPDGSGGFTFLKPEDFRVIIADGGYSRVEVDGTDLQMVTDFNKRYRIDGIYNIDLAGMIFSKTIDGDLIAGMETSPTGNYVFKVQVNKTDALGATPAFDLSGFAKVSENLTGRVGDALAYYLPRIRKTVLDIGKVGQNTITNFLDESDFSLMAAHIKDEGIISRVTIRQGNGSTRMQKVWDRTADLNNLILQEENKAPQADYFHIDHCETGYTMMEKLELAGLQTELEITSTASGKIECLLYTLERVEVRPAVA